MNNNFRRNGSCRVRFPATPFITRLPWVEGRKNIMWNVLKEIDNFVLVESQKEPGFYAFGAKRHLYDVWGFPVNQCGNVSEITDELKRQMKDIDFGNKKITKIEKIFLKTLECLEGYKNDK